MQKAGVSRWELRLSIMRDEKEVVCENWERFKDVIQSEDVVYLRKKVEGVGGVTGRSGK